MKSVWWAILTLSSWSPALPAEAGSARPTDDIATICEHLLLQRDQWREVARSLRHLRSVSRCDGFAFMGSRTHQLWRNRFDLDVTVINPRKWSRAYAIKAMHRASAACGLPFDVYPHFGTRSLRSLLRDDCLISKSEEEDLLHTSIKIWNRIATAPNQGTSVFGLGVVSVRQRSHCVG